MNKRQVKKKYIKLCGRPKADTFWTVSVMRACLEAHSRAVVISESTMREVLRNGFAPIHSVSSLRTV